MIKVVLVFIILLWPAVSLAVDALTGITGMYDSRYYKYEVRGQSTATVRLSQSLWEGGATEARIAMEKARLASSRHMLADAASSLVFDAITAHVGVARQLKLVSLAQKNMEDYSDILQMLRSRVSNGLATEGDISLVESRLFRAKAIHAEYQSDLQAARATFESVTGRQAPQNLEQPDLPKKTYASADSVFESCLARNPRLLAENESINVAEGQKKLAFSGFSPVVGIEAGPRWHVQNTPQDSVDHGVDAFLTLRWNLFEGGSTSSEVKQAAAQKRQAMHNVKSLSDQLKADIVGTWAQYRAAAERMMLYEKSMATAERARAVFYEQYLLGTKNLLDILDADNEYFLSASQYAVARADRILGAYRLLALGGDILDALNVTLPEQSKSR